MTPTRCCWACGEQKSINGVWTLLATQDQGMFVCGCCSGVEHSGDVVLRAH